MQQNISVELQPSAARTATANWEQTNDNYSGVHVIIDVTATAATPSVVFSIQGYDDASDKWYDILVSAAITATGTTVLKVAPGINSLPNGAANDVLPRKWRVLATHADADSITYSIGANYVS